MNDFCSHIRCRIEEAALNLDLWTDVFRALIAGKENPVEVTLYRQPLGESKKWIAVRVQQGADFSPPEAELVSFFGAIPGPSAIEFRLDDDLYGIRVTCPEPAADHLCRQILQVKDEIIYSVKVNRALLTAKTCFCGKGSLLGGLRDPIFRLTLDGVIVWQNDSAVNESCQQVYTGGVGKPLTLLRACEDAALRAGLLELALNSDSSTRLFPVSDPEQAHNAIMVLKVAQPCHTFISPWVELFKPEPQAFAVLRRWDSKPNLSPSALRKLYGLTAKEAELAIALAQGVPLRDYADKKAVSFETTRWHSKRVMQKMDCAKQQDVMYALLYRNALFSILD